MVLPLRLAALSALLSIAKTRVVAFLWRPALFDQPAQPDRLCLLAGQEFKKATRENAMQSVRSSILPKAEANWQWYVEQVPHSAGERVGQFAL